MSSTADSPPHILTVMGSTRQGRFGETVARRIFPMVQSRDDFTAELVDLRDWSFPYYDRPSPASATTESDYEPETLPWARLVSKADGFLIITPEYNRGYPAVLKSALDAVYAAWNRKPVAFVTAARPHRVYA